MTVTLAFDTSTKETLVAIKLLVKDGRSESDTFLYDQLVGNVDELGAPQHTGLLLEYSQQLVATHCTGWNDLDTVIVGTGPGSFTGIRIALSTAMGLKFNRKIDVVGMPFPLAAAAQVRRDQSDPSAQLIVQDGGRREYFVTLITETEQRVKPFALAGNDPKLVHELAKVNGAQIVCCDDKSLSFVADGTEEQSVSDILRVQVTPAAFIWAWEQASPEIKSRYLTAEPVYVRDPDAVKTVDR